MVLSRFRSAHGETGEEKFLVLRQDGSVRKYRQWFELLAAPLSKISEALLEGHFIKWLKPEIKAELKVLKPKGLEEIMEAAQRIQDKINMGQRYWAGPGRVQEEIKG